MIVYDNFKTSNSKKDGFFFCRVWTRSVVSSISIIIRKHPVGN